MNVVCRDLWPGAVRTCALGTARGLIPREHDNIGHNLGNDLLRTNMTDGGVTSLSSIGGCSKCCWSCLGAVYGSSEHRGNAHWHASRRRRRTSACSYCPQCTGIVRCHVSRNREHLRYLIVFPAYVLWIYCALEHCALERQYPLYVAFFVSRNLVRRFILMWILLRCRVYVHRFPISLQRQSIESIERLSTCFYRFEIRIRITKCACPITRNNIA